MTNWNNKHGINVLSLFDGMSCGQIALERAGIKVNTYLASEIDKYAMQIAKKNYPDIIHIGDVRDVHITHKLPRIDLILAGSPCQGFSFAGKQLNFDDPRSALFYEFLRILSEAKQVNPNVKFILENVKMRKDVKDAISRCLGVEPIEINSSLVSAQNRVRLYWTNIGNVEHPEDKMIFLKDIIESEYITDRDKSHCIDANYWKGGNLKSYFQKNRRQLIFKDQKKLDWRKLTPLECERLQTIPEGYTKGVSNTQRYKMLGNGWTVDVIVHILRHGS